MKLLTPFCLLFLLVSIPAAAQDTPHLPESIISAANPTSFGQLPLSFIPNLGQIDSRVRFQADGLGGRLFFTDDQLLLALPGAAETSVQVGLRFDGANPTRITGDQRQSGVVNYLKGNDPAAWRTGIPTYAGVTYSGLYDGIDVTYDGLSGTLKGTFTVAPGVSPDQIRWRYDGAQTVERDPATGNLHITIPGAEALVEQAPVAWQDINGLRVPVEAAFVVSDSANVSFALGTYDPAYTLVIDPTLVYSTYLGGSSTDIAQDIAADSDGNAYVIGFTSAADFPLVNPIDNIVVYDDVFVTKINSSGTSLVYSTYIGGLDTDRGYTITVDNEGNAYAAGQTSSVDFPTVNPIQNERLGYSNGFVTKLNASGDELLYSTYLGGGGELITGIAVDAAGYAHVVGVTYSPDFPIHNPYQATFGGGQWDMSAAKLTPEGNEFVYSTFIGGDYIDIAHDIALTPDGTAYISGSTNSLDMPIVNPIQADLIVSPECEVYHGPMDWSCVDGYIIGLTHNGDTVTFATYLGGNSSDEIFGIAIDTADNLYLAGDTTSINFPTVNALQPDMPNEGPAFIAKIDPITPELLFSTFLGGTTASSTIPPYSQYDIATSIALDVNGNIYVGGATTSADFPTVNPIQAELSYDPIHASPLEDVFITVFNADASEIRFSTYLGGAGQEYSELSLGIDVDNLGNVYIAGRTTSDDFPVYNAVQPIPGGIEFPNEWTPNHDAFVTKIALGFAVELLTPANNTELTSAQPTLTWKLYPNALSYEVQLGLTNPPTTTLVANTNSLTTPLLLTTTYYWRVRAVLPGDEFSDWSGIRQFNVISAANARLERNLFTTDTPTLSWTRVAWATGYHIQVDNNNNFASPEFQNAALGIDDLSAQTDPLPDGRYYWRVRALRSNGTWGAWSAADTFVISGG